jgi:GT2 family glycosyltransferase
MGRKMPNGVQIYKKENFSYCDVIVPVYNKIETTRLTLKAIRENSDYPFKITIVVDDSKIRSLCPNLNNFPEIIEQCEHIIINKERIGIMNAFNEVLRITRGNHIAFMMDDIIPPKGWLSKLVSATNKVPDLGMAGCFNEPRIKVERVHQPYKPIIREYSDLILDMAGIIAPPGVMKRSTVARIGLWHDGYDRFGYSDYLTRLKNAGYFNAFVEGTQSLHFHVVCKQCDSPLAVKTKQCEKCGWVYDEKNEIQNPQGPERFDENIPNFIYGDKL